MSDPRHSTRLSTLLAFSQSLVIKDIQVRDRGRGKVMYNEDKGHNTSTE